MLKRAFDVLVSTLALIVTAPMGAAIACAIKLSSRGPVIYRATRVGRGGAPFTMHKFRTMRHSSGPRVRLTAHGDPRITRIGRFLRATKLDELPQLWDVLSGSMSLVGPRPEDPRYVELYSKEQRKVLAVRPGMTGPTALAFRYEEQLLATRSDPEEFYVREVLPSKLAMDLDYVNNASFRRDLAILLRTAAAIVRRETSPRFPTGSSLKDGGEKWQD